MAVMSTPAWIKLSEIGDYFSVCSIFVSSRQDYALRLQLYSLIRDRGGELGCRGGSEKLQAPEHNLSSTQSGDWLILFADPRSLHHLCKSSLNSEEYAAKLV